MSFITILRMLYSTKNSAHHFVRDIHLFAASYYGRWCELGVSLLFVFPP